MGRRLKKAGIKRDDLGPYMKFLRPYLDRAHFEGVSGTDISGVTAVTELDEEVITWDGSTGVKEQLGLTWAGEEWTYTEISHTAPAAAGSSTATTGSDLVDEYYLTLCEQDAEEQDSETRKLLTGVEI